MTSYIGLAVIKVIDNMISTAKTICTYKGLKLASSILVAFSQLIFYLVISEIIEDNTLKAIIIVSVASGIGNYLALLLDERFSRDEKWMVALTTSNMEDVKLLCKYLAEHNIKYLASSGFDLEGNKTINVQAFSKTKTESALIDQYLESTDHKYLKEVLK